ncbi:hypothetical protein J2W42_006845 [Rhizobium tibeticum]|uniref:hypothetical protein n=1 Tax=Rhizobium tibeticum TaxID=501024 RepID=UPI0027876137|nr:hypothetical protein [Rhizobium tibeticum]MDP9813968.1 hypothetical protein [Rhizobium tibeticum]
MAYALIKANLYGVFSPMYLVIAIGLLGLAGTSVKVGQIAIIILLVMAILPEAPIQTCCSVSDPGKGRGGVSQADALDRRTPCRVLAVGCNVADCNRHHALHGGMGRRLIDLSLPYAVLDQTAG